MLGKDLSKKQKIAIVGAVLLGVIAILNFGFFWANIKFIFFKPPAESQQSTQTPGSQAENKIEPNTLIINSLGIKAPVIYPTERSEAAYQEALIDGVAHYPETALPGEKGNCYIFGHSSDYFFSKGHYKNIFAVLPKIKIGAEIIISGADGSAFVYTVTESRRVAANDLSVLDQQNYQRKLLTLQTSYPLGTALARWVIVAEEKP